MPYETDKESSGLLEFYRQFLVEFIGKPVKLLEIGIAQGGSVRFFSDLLGPQSQITGIDLHLPPGDFPANVHLRQLDQNDAKGLRALANERGPLDLIIDDGCHFLKESKLCFETLFADHLKVGGWYFIEDWAVGYWKQADKRYQGMADWVSELLGTVPSHNISAANIVLKPGQAVAAFQKGVEGWKS